MASPLQLLEVGRLFRFPPIRSVVVGFDRLPISISRRFFDRLRREFRTAVV